MEGVYRRQCLRSLDIDSKTVPSSVWVSPECETLTLSMPTQLMHSTEAIFPLDAVNDDHSKCAMRKCQGVYRVDPDHDRVHEDQVDLVVLDRDQILNEEGLI